MNTDILLDQTTLTLTPNNRLRNALTEKLVRTSMLDNETSAVTSPNIMTIADYVSYVWEHLQLHSEPYSLKHSLMTAEMELLIWVQAIEAATTINTIMSPSELAEQAISAQRRLALWKINNFNVDTQEQECFLAWQKMASTLAGDMITVEAAIAHIIRLTGSDLLPSFKHICIFSFDDIPPLHQELFSAISGPAECLESDLSNSELATPYRLENWDNASQMENVARWANTQLERNPQARLAIVIPDLTAKREQIIDALDSVFEPQACLPSTPHYTKPYNITAGRNLGQEGVVMVAMDMLNMGIGEHATNDILNLVRSPFLGSSQKERAVRARFDTYVRERRSTRLALIDVTTMSECPKALSICLGNFISRLANRPDKASLVAWVRLFEAALNAAGWPGERNLSSEEYQAMVQFVRLMQNLPQSIPDREEITFSKALFYLKRTLSCAVFAAQTKDSPIQVMGLLEAAGLTFDSMVIMDVNETIVPATASPSPFISLHTQVEYGMPHASAERELAFFEFVISRYQRSCSTLVYSYCLTNGDAELRASDFVVGEMLCDTDFASTGIEYSSALYKAIPTQVLNDMPVPFKAGEKTTGGVSVIKNTNACPFNAFITNRLSVYEIEVPKEGLSAAERGDLMHLSMYYFWSKIMTQKALLGMTESELAAELDVAIQKAFTNFNNRIDIDMTLRNMESQQLLAAMKNWMDIEKQRAPFIIKSLERTTETTIAGLTLRIRIDREDYIKDEHGKFTIELPIDYKSGKISIATLHADSMVEPQMPIYATCTDSKANGVALARINKNSSELIGIVNVNSPDNRLATPKTVRSNFSTSWEGIIQEWKDKLEDIADIYMSGQSLITPSNNSCQFCRNHLICRVNAT